MKLDLFMQPAEGVGCIYIYVHAYTDAEQDQWPSWVTCQHAHLHLLNPTIDANRPAYILKRQTTGTRRHTRNP